MDFNVLLGSKFIKTVWIKIYLITQTYLEKNQPNFLLLSRSFGPSQLKFAYFLPLLEVEGAIPPDSSTVSTPSWHHRCSVDQHVHKPPLASFIKKKKKVLSHYSTWWSEATLSSCSPSLHAVKFAASCGGSLPLFDAEGFFLVHNLYIYLTCFCVRWPPAFFKGRVLRDFLSCSLALFRSRKLLPFHKQEQRPCSCHLAGTAACTWTGTRCHRPHSGGGGRPAPPAAGPGQIWAVAWVLFHTNTDPAVWPGGRRGVESSSHTRASTRNLLLPVENTWRARGEEIQAQNETKKGEKGSWIKFYCEILLWLQEQNTTNQTFF